MTLDHFSKGHKKFNQGEFSPKHPEKYKGTYPIIWRSRWELKMCMVLDERPDVIQWGSESVAIPYHHPFKDRTARYFPDFIADIRDKEGKVTRWLIEIKPAKETTAPTRKPRQRTKTWMYAEATWMINQRKWEAAQKFCQQNGMKFKLITEKELFNRR
jgi:hypothetical protein